MSVDSHFVHKMWQQHELSKMIAGGVPYPMLSDTGGKVGRLYGVYSEETGLNVRGRFLIDPDGVVQAIEILTPPVGRNVAELIRQLQAFKHHRETGEVTPSGWYPGQQALRPSPELTGRVWERWRPPEKGPGAEPRRSGGRAEQAEMPIRHGRTAKLAKKTGVKATTRKGRGSR